MKTRFSLFIGFTTIVLAMITFSANAQEGTHDQELPDIIFNQELQEEKPFLYDPATSTEKTAQSRELLISTPKSAKPKSGDGSKNTALKPEEEDALSFNFLYYIIQKFKISDIVEQ